MTDPARPLVLVPRAFPERRFARERVLLYLTRVESTLRWLVGILSVIGLVLAWTSVPLPEIFAYDEKGQFHRLEIHRVRDDVSDAQIHRFARLAISNSFSMLHTHTDQAMEGVRPWYTASGFQNYEAALTQQMNALKIRSSNVKTVALDVRITESGPSFIGYYWQVDVRALRTYFTQSESTSSPAFYRIAIRRTPARDNREQLGIYQIVEQRGI